MEEGTRIIHLGKKNSLKDVEVLGANPISFEKAFGEFKSNASGPATKPKAKSTANANLAIHNQKAKNALALAQNAVKLIKQHHPQADAALVNSKNAYNDMRNHALSIGLKNVAPLKEQYSKVAGDTTSNQYGTTTDNGDGTYITTDANNNTYDSNADGSPLSTPAPDASGSGQSSLLPDYCTDPTGNTLSPMAQGLQSKIDTYNLFVNSEAIVPDDAYISGLTNSLAIQLQTDQNTCSIAQLTQQISDITAAVSDTATTAQNASSDATDAINAANDAQNAIGQYQQSTPSVTPDTQNIDPNTGLPVSNVAPTTPVTQTIDPNTGLPTATPTAQTPTPSVDTLTGLPTTDANAIESGSLESTNQQYPASYGQQPLTYGQAPAQPVYTSQGGDMGDQGGDMGDGGYDNEDFDTSDINPDDSSFDGTGKYMPELPYAPEDFSGFTEEQLNKTFKSEEGIEVPITIKVSQLIAEIGIVKSALLKAMWELKWATTENQVSEEGAIPQLRAKVSALKEKFNYLANILETYKRSRTAKGTPDANRLLEVTEAQKNVLAIANANRAAREAKQAKINSGKASSSQVAPIAAEIPVGGDLVKTTVVNVVSETAPTGNNGSSTNRVVELYSNADGSGDKPNSSINWKVVSLTAVGALVLVFAYNKLKK